MVKQVEFDCSLIHFRNKKSFTFFSSNLKLLISHTFCNIFVWAYMYSNLARIFHHFFCLRQIVICVVYVTNINYLKLFPNWNFFVWIQIAFPQIKLGLHDSLLFVKKKIVKFNLLKWNWFKYIYMYIVWLYFHWEQTEYYDVIYNVFYLINFGNKMHRVSV